LHSDKNYSGGTRGKTGVPPLVLIFAGAPLQKRFKVI